MIAYEVNLDVDTDVFAAFRAWLDEHVRHMLALPGFVSAEVLERTDPPPPGGRRSLCTIYRLSDAAALERYLREDAPRMRDDGLQRFPGRFSATRRVLVTA
jgi:antibiotic biosynthesis monooxygenase (ABM) superfamily enzyme